MKDINQDFLKQFNQTYATLYDNAEDGNLVDLSRVLTNTFDELVKDNKEFSGLVSKFVAMRNDFISSDRECAAFMLVFSGCMLCNA